MLLIYIYIIQQQIVMKNNTTIAKPKPQNKASLHSILYYDPASESEQKPIEPTFDALGYIKSLILVIVGQIQPDLMLITEKSIVEQGISTGWIKIPELPPIKAYYQNKLNSQQKLLEYTSKLQQPKSYAIFLTPTLPTHQPLTQTLLDIIHLLKASQTKSESPLFLSPSPSPSHSTSILYYNTTIKTRSQQQLSQLFEIAVNNNYLFLQIPVLDSIVEGVKQICIFKAVQFKSQAVYFRQCQNNKMRIDKLRIKIVEIGKLEGTGVMEVKNIWAEQVDSFYRQIVSLIGQFKDLLRVLKENQQNILQLADIQKQMIKIRELQQIRNYLLQLSEADQQIDRQSMMISNNRTNTNLLTNIQKLTTLITTLTQSTNTHKQKSHLIKARKHQLISQAQEQIKKNFAIDEEIKKMLSDFKNIDQSKSQNYNQNQNQSFRNSTFSSSSLCHIENYRTHCFEVEEEKLKMEMEEGMGHIQGLVAVVGDVWGNLGREASYGDAMLLIQQGNCQESRWSQRDSTITDPIMIMATYYIEHRLQNQLKQTDQNPQTTVSQKQQSNTLNPSKTPYTPVLQPQQRQSAQIILSNRISIQETLKQEKLSNIQKITNKIKLLQQKIEKYEIQKANQLLKSKQFIQYQLDIVGYGFELLQKCWMKVNKGKGDMKEGKTKRQTKYNI